MAAGWPLGEEGGQGDEPCPIDCDEAGVEARRKLVDSSCRRPRRGQVIVGDVTSARTSENPTAQSWRSHRNLATPGESANGAATMAICPLSQARSMVIVAPLNDLYVTGLNLASGSDSRPPANHSGVGNGPMARRSTSTFPLTSHLSRVVLGGGGEGGSLGGGSLGGSSRDRHVLRGI